MGGCGRDSQITRAVDVKTKMSEKLSEKINNSPFQRGKSKVFYQSHQVDTSLNRNNLPVFKVSRIPSEIKEPDSPTTPEDGAPTRSPSHKSQDSGFSDSGESASCGGSFSRLRKTKELMEKEKPEKKPQKLHPTSARRLGPKVAEVVDKINKINKINKMTKVNKNKLEMDGCVSDGEPEVRLSRGKSIKDSSKLSISCGNGLSNGKVVRYRKKGLLSYTGEFDMVASCLSSDEDELELKDLVGVNGGKCTKGNLRGELMEKECEKKNVASLNEPALKCHLKDSVQSLCSNTPSSVLVWMQDVRLTTQMECTNMLQNKAIAKDLSHLVAMETRNTRDNIRALQCRAKLIKMESAKLKRKVEKNKLHHLRVGIIHLNSVIKMFICDYNASSGISSQIERNVCRQQEIVLDLGNKLVELVKEEIPNGALDTEKTLAILRNLDDDFRRLVDLIVTQEIKIIIDNIEEPYNKYCLKMAIANLSNLALDGEENCRLITKAGGVRSVLTICVDVKYSQFKIQALRALATVCCVIEAIGQLQEVGGVECVSDILCDPNSSEAEKSEASGVIAQITSPWIENNHYIRGLSENLVNLIQSITNLAQNTSSEEVFLLAAAALANITFLDTKACYCLKNSNTPTVLIGACRESSCGNSIFVKDQVATVLANMVAVADCRFSVTTPGGVILLLSFLQERPNILQSEAEIDACERVQQKSAIALSRLCSNPATAKQVIQLEGVHRLVRLCKDEKERNQSDAVLVACLAALRKIATACGMDEFKDLNAIELVEPRLLDSFLICSSRQESYV